MPRKQHFQITATYQTAAILRAAAVAMCELTSGGSTRCHSFERLVQQYTGTRFTLEEIADTLCKPMSDYVRVDDATQS